MARRKTKKTVAEPAEDVAALDVPETVEAAPQKEAQDFDDEGWTQTPRDGDPALQGQFLTFQVAGEEYAISILKIREILEFAEATYVPSAPPWVVGVMNLRGSVVPVADLAIRFGLPRSQVTRQTCVVVVEVSVESELIVLGVLVDAVNRVVELNPDQIESTPRFGTVAAGDFLDGMGRVGDQFVPILDIDQLLGKDEALGVVPGGPPVADGQKVRADLAGE